MIRNEYRHALEVIIALCEKARHIPSKRQERIHDIAMEALGMTYNQREAALQAVRARAQERYLERRAA